MIDLLFLLGAYLLGSIPFALLASRAFGLADPRSYGSGNPGATNVLRSGSKPAAAATLLGDTAKGWLAVWLAGRGGASEMAIAASGMAAFLGHLYPVFIGFKGGKGVATALGVITAFSGLAAAGTALCWLLTAAVSRYSSLAALLAALAAPPLVHIALGNPAFTAATVAMAALLAWRHRGNLRRLVAGTEPKIGARKR